MSTEPHNTDAPIPTFAQSMDERYIGDFLIVSGPNIRGKMQLSAVASNGNVYHRVLKMPWTASPDVIFDESSTITECGSYIELRSGPVEIRLDRATSKW